MRGKLRQKPLCVIAPALAEEDGLKAQAAADGLFHGANAFYGDVTLAGRDTMFKGFAQLFYQRILAAGYRAQTALFLRRHSEPSY